VEGTTRYSAAFIDLNDDGKDEVIVYLIDEKWCGSGGCSALILAYQDSSYRLITKTTVTQLPIRVLSTKTDGWHDLGVWVQGGGIQPGHEARLRFNSKKYPSNPSLPARLQQKVGGKVVIPAKTQGTPLYRPHTQRLLPYNRHAPETAFNDRHFLDCRIAPTPVSSFDNQGEEK
jgi:hypothetical protein